MTQLVAFQSETKKTIRCRDETFDSLPDACCLTNNKTMQVLRNARLLRIGAKEQGWRARFPPMCLEFHSRTARHMWTEFAGFLPCREGCFFVYSGFPVSSKTSI